MKRELLIYRTGISLLFVIVFYLAGGALLGKIVNVWTETKTNQERVEEAKNWQTISRQLKEENRALEASLSQIKQTMPVRQRASGVVAFLQELANESGLQVDALQPGSTELQPDYEESRFTFRLQGRYHQLGVFIARLEASHYLAQIRELKMKADDVLNPRVEILLKLSIFQPKQLSAGS